jgi:large subunit ribosomal protein L25
MKAVSLKAFSRSKSGYTGCKSLRQGSRVPAVIYGRTVQPQNLELDLKEITDLIHHSASETILVDLSVQGEAAGPRLALVQEVQHHPLSGKVVHVDFHQVAADEPVTVALPVEAVGEAAGVKAGGVLETVLHKIKVRGLAKDLPETVQVDVSKVEIGKSVHLGEIAFPAGVKPVGDLSVPVIAVAAPISEAQEAAALESATAPLAEAEMLKEKKEEGEGAPAADAAKGKADAAKGKADAAAKPAEKAGAKPAEKAAEKKK